MTQDAVNEDGISGDQEGHGSDESTGVRLIYLDVLDAARDVLASEAVRARWSEQSALPAFTVAGLAGHLARGAFTVQTYLDAPPPDEKGTISAAEYWREANDPDIASPLNTGIRERGERQAEGGPERLLSSFDEVRSVLRDRLQREPADRRVAVFGGLPMALDDYLVTRIVETTIHSDDLAVSTGQEADLPPDAMALAAHNLLDVGLLRHGGLQILRALSRRERRSSDILRVF
jgi:uncharacterized protein (TIGR03083 family)